MIVVDTNLLAYLLLPTPFAAMADAVLMKDPTWIAPSLIHSEFRNVLLGAVRRQDVAADDAASFLARANDIVTVFGEDVDSKAVFELALRRGCSAYDCEFVWLARNLQLQLVTADKKVLNSFPELAVNPNAFLK